MMMGSAPISPDDTWKGGIDDGLTRGVPVDNGLPMRSQARQLASLGFKLPHSFGVHVDAASRFYRHGVVLKQARLSANSAP